jgi:hypothetical protein
VKHEREAAVVRILDCRLRHPGGGPRQEAPDARQPATAADFAGINSD